MIQTTIARRYARALFDLAKQGSKTDQVQGMLEEFVTAASANPGLIFSLANVFFDLNARIKVVNSLGTKMAFDPLVINFLKVLVNKGRIGLIESIVKEYKRYVFKDQSKVEAVITSAKPLSDVAYKKIEDLLAKLTHKKVMAARKIDPQVIAGISISYEGKVLDSTVSSDLERVSRHLHDVTTL